MKAEITYNVRVSEDNGDIIFIEPPKNLTIGKPNLKEYNNQAVKVAAGATNVNVPLGLVDNANVLLIVTDQNIVFKKNSDTGEAINIVADKLSGDKSYGILLLTTSGITNLYFSNSGSETANVKILLSS